MVIVVVIAKLKSALLSEEKLCAAGFFDKIVIFHLTLF